MLPKKHGQAFETKNSDEDEVDDEIPNFKKFKITIEDMEILRKRLGIMKVRKNSPHNQIIGHVRLRTGFFKIFESCDRLEILELQNDNLKETLKKVRLQSQ